MCEEVGKFPNGGLSSEDNVMLSPYNGIIVRFLHVPF